MENYLDFAISLAKEAGKNLMDNYGKMQKLEWKLKTNFKTQVDDENDKLIRKRIKERFSQHNIYSEEKDSLDLGSEFSWVCDPLDGTISYTLGCNDHFSVSIALVKGKDPILGVIYAPKREELYVAEKGKGAFCNNKLIHPSLEDNINHVIMCLAGGKETEHFKRTNILPYLEKAFSPEGIACPLEHGGGAVSLALVASGKLHAYMALSLEPWDMAAAVIINREAGAKVTNLSGKEWELGDESILVANPKLHSKLYDFLINP